jgi:hypothetical protein
MSKNAKPVRKEPADLQPELRQIAESFTPIQQRLMRAIDSLLGGAATGSSNGGIVVTDAGHRRLADALNDTMRARETIEQLATHGNCFRP